MAKKRAKSQKSGKSSNTAIAAAAVGAALLAAGGAYLASKQGAKARGKLAAWAKSARKDLKREFDKAGVASRAAFKKAASDVAKKYRRLKQLDSAETAALLADLGAQWAEVGRGVLRKRPSPKRTRRR